MRETSCGLAAQPGLTELEAERLCPAEPGRGLFPLKSPKRWHRGVCRKSVHCSSSHILFLIQKYHNSDYLRAERGGEMKETFSHWTSSGTG